MHLNRAVNDDVVAVEMLAEDDWSCPSSLVLEETEEKPDDADIEQEVRAGVHWWLVGGFLCSHT